MFWVFGPPFRKCVVWCVCFLLVGNHTRAQARIDSGEDVIVGVNKYKPTTEALIDVLQIDNAAVAAGQVIIIFTICTMLAFL